MRNTEEKCSRGKGRLAMTSSRDRLMDLNKFYEILERIQQKVEMFESLRGAIHICIMGEGFSSFPTLYGHPLDKNEQKLLDNDQSRTSKYEKL